MYYEYYQFKAVEADPDANDISMVLEAGDLVLLCQMHFDEDEVSDTYNHWVVTIDIVSDDTNYPERSLVLNPTTLHFDGDDIFVLGIASNLESIGKNDLPDVYLNVGVPVYE